MAPLFIQKPNLFKSIKKIRSFKLGLKKPTRSKKSDLLRLYFCVTLFHKLENVYDLFYVNELFYDLYT